MAKRPTKLDAIERENKLIARAFELYSQLQSIKPVQKEYDILRGELKDIWLARGDTGNRPPLVYDDIMVTFERRDVAAYEVQARTDYRINFSRLVEHDKAA